MQSSKLRYLFNITKVQREFIRNTAISSASAIVDEDTTQLKSWKEIPGPSSLPIIGPLLHFLPGGLLGNLNGLELMNKIYDTYGPIVRLDAVAGREPIIFLYDAESSSQILRGENWMPIRSGFKTLEYYRKEHKKTNDQSLKSTGLVSEHGELWKNFRSTVNPVLMQPKTIRLYRTMIDQVAKDMIDRMKSKRDENNMIRGDFEAEMNLWSLESIAVVALGSRLNSFDPNLAEDSPARRLIQCVHDLFIIADKLDFKPNIWRYIATPMFKKAMKLYEEQEELSKYFIRKAMEELKKNKGKSEEDEKGVLEKLLEINEEFAYIMATDMLFAGVDTAANTMTATLYLLAINPEKQEKLREEVMSEQEKRPYMRACIKESMRIMPIVSGNLRQTTKEYNILGYRIPKNMEVAFLHQNMSLMEKYYPRPNEFIPERWLTGKDDSLYHGNAHPFANSPFGFGVRSCIGRRIAELEVETFLARLVENFRIEWFGEPPKVLATSLNYVKGPFNFIFKDI